MSDFKEKVARGFQTAVQSLPGVTAALSLAGLGALAWICVADVPTYREAPESELSRQSFLEDLPRKKKAWIPLQSCLISLPLATWYFSRDPGYLASSALGFASLCHTVLFVNPHIVERLGEEGLGDEDINDRFRELELQNYIQCGLLGAGAVVSVMVFSQSKLR
eukprot:g42198.t1